MCFSSVGALHVEQTHSAARAVHYIQITRRLENTWRIMRACHKCANNQCGTILGWLARINTISCRSRNSVIFIVRAAIDARTRTLVENKCSRMACNRHTKINTVTRVTHEHTHTHVRQPWQRQHWACRLRRRRRRLRWRRPPTRMSLAHKANPKSWRKPSRQLSAEKKIGHPQLRPRRKTPAHNWLSNMRQRRASFFLRRLHRTSQNVPGTAATHPRQDALELWRGNRCSWHVRSHAGWQTDAWAASNRPCACGERLRVIVGEHMCVCVLCVPHLG